MVRTPQQTPRTSIPVPEALTTGDHCGIPRSHPVRHHQSLRGTLGNGARTPMSQRAIPPPGGGHGNVPARGAFPLEFLKHLADQDRLARLPGTGDGNEAHGACLGEKANPLGHRTAAEGQKLIHKRYAIEQFCSMAYLPIHSSVKRNLDTGNRRCWIEQSGGLCTSPQSGYRTMPRERLRRSLTTPAPGDAGGTTDRLPNGRCPTGTPTLGQSRAQSVAVVLALNCFQSHSAPQPGPDGGVIMPLTGTGGFSRPISRPSSSRLPSGKYS